MGPALLPTSKWKSADLLWVKNFLKDRVPYSLYFQCQLEAMSDATDMRRLYIGRDRKGLILSIAFDGAEIFTTIGDLHEEELRLITFSKGFSELHVDRAHAEVLQKFCGNRVIKTDGLLYYRLDYQTPLSLDPRCRILTAADYEEVREFFQRFYPGTIFSRWMLELPFCGLFENGNLRAVGGTVIWNKDIQMCNIGNFLTHPDFRGQGLAKILASHLVESLYHQGMRVFTLGTNELNRAAQRVYESIGFQLVERRKQIDLR